MVELYGCYEKDSKVYSLYQRNEAMEEDGTIRFKTREESRKVREELEEAIQKGIEEGRAIRNRIGAVIWIKH
jgi:DNA-directed RNA polymerase subunit L